MKFGKESKEFGKKQYWKWLNSAIDDNRQSLDLKGYNRSIDSWYSDRKIIKWHFVSFQLDRAIRIR